MVHTSKTVRGFKPFLFAIAAMAGVALGACREDDPEEYDTGVTLELRNSCEDYCSTAVACDDDRNYDECTTKCIDRMTNCQADEQDAAIAGLDVCSNESCDDFFGCSVNVGAQCIFGIDL